jgi:galactokinase
VRDQVTEAFKTLYGRDPAIIARAPGRVNLLGAHVDYNEGWVLPGAIDRAIWLAAAPRKDRIVRISSLDFRQEGEADLSTLQAGTTPQLVREPGPTWLNYPAGVAWVMMDAGYDLVGMDVVFAGDIPVGAGVSSSAAVEVAFILAWEALSEQTIDELERAKIGQRVENDYLGLGSGIMDQFASIHGQSGKLILLDCRTLVHAFKPFPADTVVLVVDSGIRRELAHSEYNVRRQQCQEATAILKRYVPNIRTLRDVTVQEFHDYAAQLPSILRRRAQHVVEECARVLEGVVALEEQDLDRFGELVIGSHISSRDLYEVSIPELDLLASSAWDTPGCYGARLTGAGFGGCVVAVVEQAAASDVASGISMAFVKEYGRRPTQFACKIGRGATCELL